MRANQSSAFMLSLMMHGGLAALLFFFAYAMHQQVKEAPKIFELVAGEGDNYNATEAPALGVPGGVKFTMPTPLSTPTPEPVQIDPLPEPPAPEPVVEHAPVPKPTPPKPVEKVVEKAAAKPVETKAPNYKKDLMRIADKREKRLVEADRKKREAAEKAAAAKAAKMTKAEFDKLNKGKNSPSGAKGAATKVAKIDGEGIAKGVVGGSTNNKTGGAGGKALSRAEQDALDSYIAMLIQRLRAAHEKPPGLSDLLEARVQFRIAANGTISDVKIVGSSGSSEFDQSVLAAFARVRSIGATPNGKSDTWIVTFKMREEE